MPIEIELPDGTVVEFPDGTSNDVMKSALAKRFAPAGATQPTQTTSRSWSDVPMEALQNAPSSAAKFASDIVQPILHPIETVKGIANIGYGLASKTAGALGAQQDPQEKAQDEATVDAIGGFIRDRYGSMDALKKTLATDPVGALGDASLVLSGGGAAARLPGATGRIGQAARTAANVVDPLALAGRTAAGAGRFASEALGVTTGASGRPIREAYQAGRTGNTAFPAHMRDQRPIEHIVDMAEAGLDTMTTNRRNQYNRDMAGTRALQTPVDMMPVRRALDRMGASIHHRGIVKDPRAAAVHTQMVNLFNEFNQLPPVERTAEALDAFKQGIGSIRDSVPFNERNARRVAGNVYRAVGQEIRRQSPSYDAAMRNYSDAADQITEIRRALSVGNNAAADTTARKLTSVMRNNVNTNYGARARLADELGRHQPDLMPSIAGAALSAWHPRGLAVLGPVMATGMGAATMNPASLMAGLATAPFASPRLVGEAAYGLGSGARLATRGAQMVGADRLAPALPFAYFGLNALRPALSGPGLLED
jgi:hypothetical protein